MADVTSGKACNTSARWQVAHCTKTPARRACAATCDQRNQRATVRNMVGYAIRQGAVAAFACHGRVGRAIASTFAFAGEGSASGSAGGSRPQDHSLTACRVRLVWTCRQGCRPAVVSCRLPWFTPPDFLCFSGRVSSTIAAAASKASLGRADRVGSALFSLWHNPLRFVAPMIWRLPHIITRIARRRPKPTSKENQRHRAKNHLTS
jgi:hypothetical protein